MAETAARQRHGAAAGADPVRPTASGSRRPELDWLRVTLFAGLILYHEGLIYAPWSPWVEKSVHRTPGLEPLLLLTHPWRMSLLFLISGAATRHMADKRSPGALFAGRSSRLLPPLAFAFLVLIPIQGYVMLAQVAAYADGYQEFLRRYFTLGHTVVVQGLSYKLPVYGHLWFVFYLWAYTLALAAALAAAPGALRAGQRWADRLLSGPGLLIWPMLALTALRLTAYPAFGVTLGFVDDGYNHMVSGGLFLLGFLTGKSDRVWESAVRFRWTALGMAALGYAVYAAAAAHYGGLPERIELRHPELAVFYGLEQWGAIAALMGFARRHLTRSTPSLAYLNGGIFAFYIVHQPAMLLALYWLKPLNLAAVPEALLIALATVAACALAYELARRLPVLDALLGCTPSASKRSPLAKARPPTRRAQPSYDPGG